MFSLKTAQSRAVMQKLNWKLFILPFTILLIKFLKIADYLPQIFGFVVKLHQLKSASILQSQ